MRTIIAFVLFWIPMIPIAILNGTLRQFLISPYTTELTAHQISSLTAIVFFTIYTWFLLRRHPLSSNAQAVFGGIIWLVLTISFEFLFGHFVVGLPWETLINDYNILNGRLWVLVLIAITILPPSINKIISKLNNS